MSVDLLTLKVSKLCFFSLKPKAKVQLAPCSAQLKPDGQNNLKNPMPLGRRNSMGMCPKSKLHLSARVLSHRYHMNHPELVMTALSPVSQGYSAASSLSPKSRPSLTTGFLASLVCWLYCTSPFCYGNYVDDMHFKGESGPWCSHTLNCWRKCQQGSAGAGDRLRVGSHQREAER